LFILDLGPGRVVRELRHASVDHREPLDRLPTSFSPDERYLAVVNRNNSISLFDLSRGTEVSNIIDEDIYGIQFGVDEPRKSAVALDQTTTRRHGLGTVRALAFSSNGRDPSRKQTVNRGK
jgi:WD40 repeat protein